MVIMQTLPAYCMQLMLFFGIVFAHQPLNFTDPTLLERLAGVESLVSAGKDSGPFLLLNTNSGLCVQPAADTLDADHDPVSMALIMLPDGCNNSYLHAQYTFTTSGMLVHNNSGWCVGPMFTPGQDHPTPRVVLKDCQKGDGASDTSNLQWRVTAQASLVHKSSGMCLHPSNGQPLPGVSLQLHHECDKERLEFMPVRPEQVANWLRSGSSENDLDLKGGRKQSRWPAPLCCAGGKCLLKPRKQRKNTFLTTARASRYVQAVRGLACSLAKTNPGSHLIVMGAPSDSNRLSTSDMAYLKHNASVPGLTVKYVIVPDIDFPNYFTPRFHLNWIKLHAWNLTEWDAIIMLDADMAVVGDLKHLYNLPHHYANVPEQAPGFSWNTGGFKFLRPCRAVFEHMVSLLLQYQGLQFRNTFSEQNFLDWYFRYDSFNLPFSYHANAHQHPDLRSHGTVTGLQPILLHFADKKPWEVPSNDTLSKYANPCSEAFPVTIAPPSPSKGYALPRLRKHVNRHHRRRAGEDASGCVEHRIIDAR